MADNDGDGQENRLIAERRAKLARLRERGVAFPNDFKRTELAGELVAAFQAHSAESLLASPRTVAVAGRLMVKRITGAITFVKIQDRSGQIQLLVRRDRVGEAFYAEFKKWDIGDVVGASGELIKTKTGELSVDAGSLRLLVKSLRPLPEKWHGIADAEFKLRQRYVDLIMSDDAREVFRKRSALVRFIRGFLDALDFTEVETPMMQPIPGGATARPFVTHHNALDTALFLRIAPELYLKRLVVGGLEKVFEINRNFRNEGISTRHNPEFTMLEFYEAYRDYRYLMDLSEELLREVALKACGTTTIEYQDVRIDLSGPFDRLTMAEAIAKYNPRHSPAE